jgi:hypothetical protein
VFAHVRSKALNLGENEPKIIFVSAERVPDLSLVQVEETEVIYVLAPHAVRLPAVRQKPVKSTIEWDEVRENLVTNMAAFAYAIGFTVTLALFVVGAFVLKSMIFGVNETQTGTYKVGISAPKTDGARV